MYTPLTLGNRPVQKKVEERTYRLHLERLRTIKKSASQTHTLQNQDAELFKSTSKLMKQNKKKEALQETNLLKIERENRILLNKMADIINNNNKKTGIALGFSASSSELNSFRVKSLNQNVRRNEFSRIMVENQHMIKRIQQQSSRFDIEQWKEDYKKTEKQLQSLSNFPTIRGSKMSSRKTSRRSSKEKGFDFIPLNLNAARHSSNIVSSRRSSVQDKLPGSRTERISTTIAKKLVLHKTEAKIGIKFYYIEFILTKRHFVIRIEGIKSGKSRKIVLDIDRGNQIVEEHQGNYDKIASKLILKDGKFYFLEFEELPRKGHTKEKLHDALNDTKLLLFENQNINGGENGEKEPQTQRNDQEIIHLKDFASPEENQENQKVEN